MRFAITIEPLQKSHIEEILRIQTENNLGWWQPQDYFEEIRRTDSVSFVAKKDKILVGFIISRLITTGFNKNNNPINNFNSKSESGSEIEIYNLAVDKIHRKKGIGRLLIQKIIQVGIRSRTTSIWLEVRASNSTAVSFYKENNFKEVYRRKNFYSHPQEDALVMKLDFFEEEKS